MLTVHGRNTKQRVPVEGTRFEPNPQTPLQRGTSPLEIWYSGVVNQTAYSTVSVGNDFLRAYPVVIGRSTVIDRIAFEQTTAGGVGSVGRCGIYASGVKPNYYPTSLVVDSGEIACDGANEIKSTSISISLPAGLYWFTMITGVAAQPTLRGYAQGAPGPILGIPSTMGVTPSTRIAAAFTYAALPSSYPAGAIISTSTTQLVHIRLST